MEEDIDTRKINNSFLRDHSYATEGNACSAAFRCWGRCKLRMAVLPPWPGTQWQRLLCSLELVALGGGSG